MPDFWSDRRKAQITMQELSMLRKHVKSWDKITNKINDLAATIETTRESDHDMIVEIERNYNQILTEYEKKEFELLFSDEFDRNNAIF